MSFKSIKFHAWLLSCLGLVPIIFSLVSYYQGSQSIGAFYLFYMALVVNFLAGTSWAVAVQHKNSQTLYWGILPTFICAIAYLYQVDMGSFAFIMAVLMTGQLMVDYKIYRLEVWERWYFKLRAFATSAILLMHVVAALINWGSSG